VNETWGTTEDSDCVPDPEGAVSGKAPRLSSSPGAKGIIVDTATATVVIQKRLRQRLLPEAVFWRCAGEYVGGNPCDGCGERITSAQASYVVDFAAGVNPQSVRFHRVCFEIWQRECQKLAPV
jgi:hypothetical protein